MDTERIDTRGLDPKLRVPRDAYDRFRHQLEAAAERLAGRFGKDATSLVLLVPDLLLLFAGLSRDPRVGRRHKLLAAAVVAYLVSPIDLLPEAVFGPLGLGDDIALAFLALDAILNQVPHQVVLDHWRGERDLIEVARLGTALGARLIPPRLHAKVKRWLARVAT
jgi:uncharacterized membrane protein YkvA (DUF1232 family)